MSEPLQQIESAPRTASMMNRVVASSLRQRFLVILLTFVLIGAGTRSLERLPVDAYPDLSPPIVEIITQWPGHAAEEVERLITVPVEVGMNGIPKMTTQRSITLYGLSDVILTYARWHGQQFRAAGSFQPAVQPEPADRRDAFGVAAVVAVGFDLSLRAAKLRPLADGTENVRGLDHRTGLQIARGCGGRFRLWRRHDAISSAARSGQDCGRRPVGVASGSRARGQQRQCRRRFLFARRTVLLRARPRSIGNLGRHRQRGAGGEQWHAGVAEERRPRGHRHRAAARRIRFREAGRLRGRRHPLAHGRQDPGRA
jgi:hypothetical protein